MGKEVSRILYAHNASVHLACRSDPRATAAIADIQKAVPASKGKLAFLKLDLADLSTIKSSVDAFLARETQLHGLFNNAGVMYVDTKGPQKTPQGYEMNLGVNVLGTFLFTKLLTSTLVSTAKTQPAGSIRIVWLSSLGLELSGEKSIGLSLGDWEEKAKKPGMERYAMSKAGNWLHGAECAQRLKKDGVVSVPINPGNLNTELARQHPKFVQWILSLIVYPVVYGALTQVYAMFSKDIGVENSGIWGKWFPRGAQMECDGWLIGFSGSIWAAAASARGSARCDEIARGGW